MQIRKLGTWEEKLKADRVLAVAFLHDWNEEEARKKRMDEASADTEPEDEIWASFDDAGKMTAAISTVRKEMFFDGKSYPVGEVHMVGSLPEGRESGNIRGLMREVLLDFRRRGDLLSVLIPFNFSFYRKFGFDLIQCNLSQRAAVSQFAGFMPSLKVSQLSGEDEIVEMKELFRRFASGYNLSEIKKEDHWRYRGNGEIGERDWMNKDREKYTYLFRDDTGALRGYVSFIFVFKDNPFIGEMNVCELIYDGPEALKSIFGFIYRMRAKMTHVNFDLPLDMDLAFMLPDCGGVERTHEGHFMARLLDVKRVLMNMKHPDGKGTYTVRQEDRFLSEDSAAYRVSYEDGKAVSVDEIAGDADVFVTSETLCQLCIGAISLKEAEYREGTRIISNRETLEKVFVRKSVFIF
ncbi:MAG: GNAT family N-acetyltransferase [Christensenellaceae bacterium]|nr:GNAT family N-acetyltransferase [Christensenellaceae bacterium]